MSDTGTCAHCGHEKRLHLASNHDADCMVLGWACHQDFAAAPLASPDDKWPMYDAALRGLALASTDPTPPDASPTTGIVTMVGELSRAHALLDHLGVLPSSRYYKVPPLDERIQSLADALDAGFPGHADPTPPDDGLNSLNVFDRLRETEARLSRLQQEHGDLLKDYAEARAETAALRQDRDRLETRVIGLRNALADIFDGNLYGERGHFAIARDALDADDKLRAAPPQEDATSLCPESSCLNLAACRKAERCIERTEAVS